MTIAQTIRTRHARRDYLDKPVNRAVIEDVIGAALWAPSGVTAQPST